MGHVKFNFDNHILDTDLRELRRGGEMIAMQPQVFDLLVHLLKYRDRVVSWYGEDGSSRTRRWTAGSTPLETRSATTARNSGSFAPFRAREFASSAP